MNDFVCIGDLVELREGNYLLRSVPMRRYLDMIDLSQNSFCVLDEDDCYNLFVVISKASSYLCGINDLCLMQVSTGILGWRDSASCLKLTK
jgi:hypothetical protein